jgi:5'-deoxynucleotidase YfbR-like HD superfamily hydrolase
MNPKIKAARKAGRVMRYHNREVFRPEDVAQHTFNMMNLIMIMTEGTASQNLLKAALLHDQGEYVTGDIPSPVKRLINSSELGTMELSGVNFIHRHGVPLLTDWQQEILKLADNLDGLLRCTEEVGRGNWDMLEVGNTYVLYLGKQLEELGGGQIVDIVRDAISEWVEVIK